MRILYACQKCGEEFGEGEQNRGRCPHCNQGYGDPVGECEDDPAAELISETPGYIIQSTEPKRKGD